ncbi:LptF/LptG family permease [Alphaproteobacteria bacterium]|nr:LptF/LptG family permease [Alphaproteobacteria bacterium]
MTKELIQFFLFALFSLIILIFFIDLVELFRRSSNKIGVTHLQSAGFYNIIGMAGLKIPNNIEKILPFATLIGSIICFNQWRKKNYYIISRTFGISLWKTITPALISFFLIGIISIILLNPLSAIFNKKYNALQTLYFGKKNHKTFTFDTKGFWIREISKESKLIINAVKIDDINNTLHNVNVFVFDKEKNFQQKLSAKKAKFTENALNLYEVDLISRTEKFSNLKKYTFNVKSKSNVFNVAVSKADTIFILDLPSYVFKMKKYGLNISDHLLHFFKLVCQPFLVISMILLSASLMLRSSERKVEVGMVSITLVLGFSLYFIGDFIFALGSSEKLPPLLAGFGPTLIGLFSGCYLISDIDEPKNI